LGKKRRFHYVGEGGQARGRLGGGGGLGKRERAGHSFPEFGLCKKVGGEKSLKGGGGGMVGLEKLKVG